jgi:ribose transport system substrate-binding protein
MEGKEMSMSSLSRKPFKALLVLVVIGTMAAALVGCGAPTEAPETEEPTAVEEPTEAPATEEEPTGGEGGEAFTIGVSNGFVGSEWRTQMIQNMQEVNQEYMDQGLTNELIIESADVDVQGQIQQIQNLINRGVDAIIINPNDQNALNSVIEEAVNAGIVVIAVDQEVSSEQALNVVTNQKQWAMISARWLMDQLGGSGDIVLIEGVVGHPANEARMEGVEEVLSEYPDVEVVGRDTGNWDQATGQQVMSDFLASLPNIDGVWTQDGMAEGALRAVRTADPEEWPVMVGEARAGYLQLWNEVKQERPDFTSIGVVNPPGQGVSGLRVALEILQGREVADDALRGEFGNTLYIPIPGVVTEENFQEIYEQYQDRPASYTLDGWITEEQAVQLMEGEITAEDLMGDLPYTGETEAAEPETPTVEASFTPPEQDTPEEISAVLPVAEDVEGAPFTIGVSNGFVGSEWRTQMIQDLQEANAAYMELGLTNELLIESADVDVQGQIQQIQNLMNQGADAIIINPNDQNALNSVIQEAVDEGVVVIAVDQEVSSEAVLNVVTNQKEWAKISARWLVDQLGGSGDVVLIEGVVGHPANEARMEGVEEVFSEYPELEVVGRDTGNWDQATGQQVMSDFLASLPNIDGVWTQDGMAEGALRAIRTANPDEWPVSTGEARAGFLQLWNEVKQERSDFTSIGVVNPPGQGASGLRVALELLTGSQVDETQLEGEFGNTLYIPIPGVVTEENFQDVYEMYSDAPASYTLDGWISQEDAHAFMQ